MIEPSAASERDPYGATVALFHRATITPTKQELLDRWVPTQPWCPGGTERVEILGSFRFDDPEGRVGMETHLVDAGELLQVPLTYRDAPLDAAEDALVGTMEHSALGNRWVYDGLRDPRYVVMLAGVAMTGQGEALGMVDNEGRWYVVPSNVRIRGGGWTYERVAVDGFVLESDEASASVLRNDRFELTVFRQPATGERPAMGLTASVDGRDPVVLAAVREVSS